MHHHEKFAALMARIPEIVENAVEHISGSSYFVALVVVPHHDLCKPFSEALREALLDAGFAIDKANSHRVSGDEISVFVSAPSYLAGKGLSLNMVYLPAADGITAGQRKIITEWKHAMVPTFAPHGGQMVEY